MRSLSNINNIFSIQSDQKLDLAKELIEEEDSGEKLSSQIDDNLKSDVSN